MKTPITAADLLNHRVLPLLEEEQLPLLRILTDRGTEYCGKPDSHDFQLYLALNNLNTRKLRQDPLKQTGSVSGSTEPFFRSFTRLHFERKYIEILMNYSMIWMTGFCPTITKGHIRERCVAVEHLWKPWKPERHCGKIKN